MKSTCFIIDDDPVAIKFIELILEQIDEIEVIGTYTESVKAAYEVVLRKPDLLFLDINMPGLDGFEFLETLDTPPKIIIVSGSDITPPSGSRDYIVDYISKPISGKKRVEESLIKANILTPKPTGKNILICETDEAIAVMIQYKLGKHHDCKITMTDGGKEALKLVNNNSYDVIISSTDLKNYTGFDLFKHVRKELGKTNPFLLMLNNDLDKNKAESLKADHISKPFSPGEISEQVERLLAS